MIFYSILFSLDGKHQDYTHCFWLLLTSLIRSKTLQKEDKYYLLSDDASWMAVSRLPQVSTHVVRLPIKTPPDCFEGMKYKYLLPESLVSQQDVVVYLDVDMLSIRPFRPELPPDTLAAYPEGDPDDSNYKGWTDFPLPVGCSAGFFVWTPGPRVKAIFSGILDEMERDRRPFYTLDQPYFNKHVSCSSRYIHPQVVSYNGHTNRDTCAFLNLCGEPGDGPFHFEKMLNVYLQLF